MTDPDVADARGLSPSATTGDTGREGFPFSIPAHPPLVDGVSRQVVLDALDSLCRAASTG